MVSKKPKNKKLSGLKATALVDRLRNMYKGAVEAEGTAKWRAAASQALRFYDGTGQWDDAVRMTLEQQGKPCLTINRILPTINVVWGQQQKNRTEIRLEARHRGTKALAGLGSSLIKHAMESCNGYDANSDTFRDGIITGKGWVTVDHVYERDPISGELLIAAPNPLTMYEDPRNTAFDVNQGEFLFRERFVPKAMLKAYYPDEAEEAIDAAGHDWSAGPVEEAWDGSTQSLLNVLNGRESRRFWQGELAGVIAREAWWKEYERATMFAVTVDGRTITAKVKDKADEAKLRGLARKLPGVEVDSVETVITTLHLAVLVGDVLLKYEEDPLHGMTVFPYARYSPYWLHGEAFGIVDNLIGPQQEHNKHRSQVLHQLNQSGNPGWKATRATPKGRQVIEKYGSTPGVLLEEDDFGGKIDRIQPEGLNNGIMTLSETSAADIREISGANPDLLGTQPEQSESGRARLIRQEAGQTTLAPVVGNLYRTQSRLGDMIWEYIRHNEVYTPEEIEMIVDQDIIDQLGGMQGVVEAMNDWDAGTYGIKAAPAKTTTTWRDVQLTEIQDVAQSVSSLGMAMPPDIGQALLVEVLSLSSFPGAEKIAEMVKGRVMQPQLPAGPAGSGGPSSPAGAQQGTPAGAVVSAQGGAPY